MEEAYERKLHRYIDTVKDCIASEWNVVCYPVEVGAWGFVARSMIKLVKELGWNTENQKLVDRTKIH